VSFPWHGNGIRPNAETRAATTTIDRHKTKAETPGVASRRGNVIHARAAAKVRAVLNGKISPRYFAPIARGEG